VLALYKREGVDAAPLRKRLDDEQRKLNEREHPTTLEGFVSAFMPRTGKARQYLEALFGLVAPFEGRLDVPASHVAKHFGITAPNIYILLNKQRERWAQHASADDLVNRATEIVRENGGAISMARAARILVSRFPGDDSVSEELRVTRAATLLRIAAELERERTKQRHHARLGDGEPWLFAREPDAAKLAELGLAADALAERDPLASPAEAARQLALIVDATPLATLSAPRLVELACVASKKAGCSARLEVYPRGLLPARVLALTATVLKGGVAPDEVAQRARERYPLAAPLPIRPELDELMRGIGFEWREAEQGYSRPGEGAHTSLGTELVGPGSRFTTAPTGQPRRQTAGALAARDFDQRLRAALEEDAFRVVGLSIDQGGLATRRLAQVLGIAPTSFDTLFLRELDELTQTGKPSVDLVLDTDGQGATSPGWSNLKKLAERCAERVLAQLVPIRTPLLLHQLGLVARYELTDFLHKLVANAQSRDAKAVFLLMPCPDTGALPRINGTLSVPGLLPGQALWVPSEWLKNMHNAAA
jgi:hypothetical protein